MTRPSRRACGPCRIGEHEFCEGSEDIVIGGVTAVPLNCSCTHGVPVARSAASTELRDQFRATVQTVKVGDRVALGLVEKEVLNILGLSGNCKRLLFGDSDSFVLAPGAELWATRPRSDSRSSG